VRRIHVGSYTAATGGVGHGIETFEHDPVSGTLVRTGSLALDCPTWLLAHPGGEFCYATNEVPDGRLTVLRREGAKLIPVAEWHTGGGHPCHLYLRDDLLLCSNYVDGSLAVFRVDARGVIVEHTGSVRHVGRGPHPERQQGPHVHMADIRADGIVRVVDLGLDAVIAYRVDESRQLHEIARLELPPGFGPRQLADLPDGRVVVLGELASAVAVAEFDAAGASRVISTAPASAAGSDEAANLPAQLDVRPDGLVRVSNRGRDCVTTLRVGADTIEVLTDQPVGSGPRHVAYVDDLMYVAAQDANAIEVHRLAPPGRPGESSSGLSASLPVGSPAFVLVD
jgi:6-phosphogluconolactonase